MTPDQSMQDEGIAREVINRVQKLRKRAHLVPTDSIKVFYSVTAKSELERICTEYASFIEQTIKAPFSSDTVSGNLVIEETQQVTSYIRLSVFFLHDPTRSVLL